MDALSYEIMTFAFRAAPKVADARADGREQHVGQHPELAEKTDLLCRAQVRCERAQCRTHVVDDAFN
ncbi:hypothetical protein D3C84_1160810 [compost metagenome]